MPAPISVQPSATYFRTDDAWDGVLPANFIDLPVQDIRDLARSLRFITTSKTVEDFFRKYGPSFRPFTLFGSGDFHHLTAVWLRQFEQPLTLFSFDNHPDWDIRPPRWSCGAWINRALENRLVQEISVWGCHSFECNFPGRLLGNRREASSGRLRVQPWAQPKGRYPEWLHPIDASNWKIRFTDEARRVRGRRLYVTIDLDCLERDEAVTNWESGRFRCDDLLWALKTLRQEATLVGGDLCGAYSSPEYAGWMQRLAGRFDHPQLADVPEAERNRRNCHAFTTLWPALTQSSIFTPPPPVSALRNAEK